MVVVVSAVGFCLPDELQQRDTLIKKCCDEKMKLILEMLESYGRDESVTSVSTGHRGRHWYLIQHVLSFRER